MHRLLLALVPVLALSACDGGEKIIENPTFEADIQPIFEGRCLGSGCHDAVTKGGDLDMVSSDMYDALVEVVSTANIPIVDASGGDAALENSYLWLKLEDRQADVGGDGAKMPLTGGALSEVQQTNVENWILDGAPR